MVVDVSVLNLWPFSTLTINFNCNAGRNEGPFIGVPNLVKLHQVLFTPSNAREG